MGSLNGETHEISIERARGVDRFSDRLRFEFPIITIKHDYDWNTGLDRGQLVDADDDGVCTESGFDLGRRNGHLDEQ